MNFDSKAITLRGDLLVDKKCVHIKLDKDTHTALRSLCFHKGISMQDIFEVFARALCEGDSKAIGIIDKTILQRLNLPKRASKYRKKTATELGDKEKDALYDMINNEQEERD